MNLRQPDRQPAVRPMRHLAIAAFAAVAILGGLIGAVFASGYIVGDREVTPYRFVKKVENKLVQIFGVTERPPGLEAQTYPTALLRLSSEVVRLPAADSYHPVAGSGGGLADFGGEVMLVTFDGRFFAAMDKDTLRELRIEAPDNGRSAYEALAADPSLSHLQIRKGYLRYNDILTLEREVADDSRHRQLVLSYTDFDAERRCYRNAVAVADVAADVRTADDLLIEKHDWRILTLTEPCLELKERHFAIEGHMAGGRMAFRAPSTLILTSGDFHIDGMRSEPGYAIAQDPDAQYGKILSVDIDNGATQTLSTGHRNPQGVALWTDGTPMVIEHGPRGGDEINMVQNGANYGWPLESLGTAYDSRGPLPGAQSFGRHDSFPGPFYAWVPSIAPSAIAVAQGVHAAWDGDILVTSLIDQSLHRMRVKDDRVVYSERIPIGARLRDIQVQDDGRLVLWTDSRELVFLSAVDYVSLDILIAEISLRRGWSDSAQQEVVAAAALCAECHAFDPDDHQKAPGLTRVFGAPIASTPFEGYSDALRDVGGVWDEETLRAYILDPDSVAPGTSMPATGLTDPDTIDRLVLFLKDISIAF